MEQPIAYFADDGRSWRCDGCGSYGSVGDAANGRRYAARHVAMHIEECTPAQAGAIDHIVIRPGDTVLVCVPADTSSTQARRIGEQLRERLPDVADVLVLAGAHGITAYRPSGE